MATKINLPREDTMQDILTTLQTIAAMQEIMAADAISSIYTDVSEIQRIVKAGLASSVFSVGDQITVTYTYGSTSYDMPFDVVHIADVELPDGETVPGLWLQSHYATIESLMFDSYEAFYVANDGLEAGIYNITAGFSENSLVSGTSYQFTLTEDVPAGGVLAGFRRAAASDVTDLTTLYVYSYESLESGYSDYIEAASISEGTDGTNLGTFYKTSAAADSGLNHAQRFIYGYGRWSQSAYRQWLNSAADAGLWWSPQNDYDLPPSQLSNYAGFMAGFEDDILDVLATIKVTTALNTVEGLSDTSEDTEDVFFLPSLEQIYVTPQLSGVEGDYWEYWMRALGEESPTAQYATDAERITYMLSSRTSAQSVRLRSASRGGAYGTWCVGSSGYVDGYGACYATRCAPACVIA